MFIYRLPWFLFLFPQLSKLPLLTFIPSHWRPNWFEFIGSHSFSYHLPQVLLKAIATSPPFFLELQSYISNKLHVADFHQLLVFRYFNPRLSHQINHLTFYISCHLHFHFKIPLSSLENMKSMGVIPLLPSYTFSSHLFIQQILNTSNFSGIWIDSGGNIEQNRLLPVLIECILYSCSCWWKSCSFTGSQGRHSRGSPTGGCDVVRLICGTRWKMKAVPLGFQCPISVRSAMEKLPSCLHQA